jgi:beta-ribofuranosylaminobenzene 5'-phosphate synthase
MKTHITLRAYPRLHFGLVDLSGATQRSYGGIGAAFEGPSTRIDAVDSSHLDVNLEDLDQETRASVSRALSNITDRRLKVTGVFAVAERMPSHVGLGSTTATTLALLKSMDLINDWGLGSTALIDMSSRGRTSGVGSHTFFDGGLIADVGQRAHPTGVYRPSLAPNDRSPSLKLGRWLMPSQWRVHLLFSATRPSVPPEQEAEFFSLVTPTEHSETLTQLAALYHGIVPAALEEDLIRFAGALREFQSVGFKAREIAAQPEIVRATLEVLWSEGLAAGLSSLGPTVFVISEDAGPRLAALLGGNVEVQGPYALRNEGYHEFHE